MDETDPRLICAGYWDGEDDYPIEDWRYDVANGDTMLGYHEWVEHQKEIPND